MVFSILTLHVPTPPDHIIEPYLVLPSKPDAFESIPLGRRQLLSGTNLLFPSWVEFKFHSILSHENRSFHIKKGKSWSWKLLWSIAREISDSKHYREAHFAPVVPMIQIIRYYWHEIFRKKDVIVKCSSIEQTGQNRLFFLRYISLEIERNQFQHFKSLSSSDVLKKKVKYSNVYLKMLKSFQVTFSNSSSHSSHLIIWKISNLPLLPSSVNTILELSLVLEDL